VSKIIGVNTREVWDFRLSTATVRIMRQKTWIVEIWSKTLPDYHPERVVSDCDGETGEPIPGTERKVPETPPAEPLQVHDTKIPVEKGDDHDRKKISVCFEWLKSVRDDYALPNIEELKPVVAEINRINAELAEVQAGLTPVEAIQVWNFIKEVKLIAEKSGLTTDEVLQKMVNGMTGEAQ